MPCAALQPTSKPGRPHGCPSQERTSQKSYSALILARQGVCARLLRPPCVDEVVNVRIAAQPVAAGQGVVAHADDFIGFELDALGPARELGRLDEFSVVVGAAREHLEDVLGTDDREQVGFRVAVQGGEENVSTGLHEARASSNGTGGIRNVFEHLHAGNDIEFARCFGCQFFGGDFAVSDLSAALQKVQAGDGQCFVRKVDPGDLRSALGERFSQDASAAADIENKNYAAAIDRLKKIEDKPYAWNNLAVAYRLMGNKEKADVYFKKWADSGANDGKISWKVIQGDN